jgi:hypothetical protein
MNFAAGKSKWILLIGGLLVCGVCALILTGGNLLRGNPTTSVPPVSQGAPANDFTPVPIDQGSGENVQLGEVVTARTLKTKNQPGEVTTQFSQSEPVIYAVTQGRQVPQGTHIFARWSRDGQPIEDTNEIVADRTYQDTYIEFHIAPSGVALTPGDYTVQFFVNGNPGPMAEFTVS